MRRMLDASIVAASVAGLLAMAYGQYEIRLHPQDGQATMAFLAAALVTALLLGRAPIDTPGAVASQRRGTLIRAMGSLLVVLGLAGVGAGSYFLSQNFQLWFARGAGLLLAGTAALSLGFWTFDPSPAARRPWSWSEIAAVAALVALGGFLRFYRLEEFPDAYGIHAIEEPQVGMRAYQLLKQHVIAWEFMFDNFLGAAGLYLTGEQSINAIRLSYAAASTLTVLVIHCVLRQLVSTPAALAGTFLYAVSSWNIIYARCAHAVFPANIIVVAVVAVLLWFGRTQRLAVVPWGAFLSGYTFYAYAGYRGTTLVALVFIAMQVARHLWRFATTLDAGVKRAAAYAVGRDMIAGVVFTIYGAALLTPVVLLTRSNQAQPNVYFEAANRSFSNKQYYTSDPSAFLQQRLDRIRETARIFMHFGDGSNTFNAPGEPMVDPLTAVCFVGGLFLAACFPFRGFNSFLVFMFLFLLAGGAVFVQNLDVRRLQGVVPFVAIFAALFIDQLWALVQRLPRTLLLIVVTLVCTAGGAFALAWNYNIYFNKMAKDTAVRQAFKNYYTILIHYGHTRGRDRETLLLSDVKSFFTPSDYYWMVDGVFAGRALSDLSEILPPQGLPPSHQPRTVVIQVPFERQAVAHLLTQVYPGTVCSEFVEPDNPYISLTLCDLPPQPTAQPMTSTLEARYWIGPAAEGEPIIARREPFIGFALVPRDCYFPTPQKQGDVCTVEWVGTLVVPEEGQYEFNTEVRGLAKAETTIDGQPPPNGPLTLTAGPHTIAVHARLPRTPETGVRLTWKTPKGFEPVPFFHVGPQAAAADETAPPPAPTETGPTATAP